MLLRWFITLYSSEIIEEEAFLKWKEDISDQYPGKGKALFQASAISEGKFVWIVVAGERGTTLFIILLIWCCLNIGEPVVDLVGRS